MFRHSVCPNVLAALLFLSLSSFFLAVKWAAIGSECLVAFSRSLMHILLLLVFSLAVSLWRGWHLSGYLTRAFSRPVALH